jgi:hypothetical protein
MVTEKEEKNPKRASQILHHEWEMKEGQDAGNLTHRVDQFSG